VQTLNAPRPASNAVSQACNCAATDYEPGSPCYDQCGGGGGGGDTGGGGSCPDGTPGGYADCCPPGPNGQRVWSPDTKTCEYEDDRQKRGEDTCRDNGGLPIQCPPGQESWCNFTTGLQQCASVGGGHSGGAPGGGGGGGSSSIAFPEQYVGDDINKLLGRMIRKDLKAPSRFTPEILQQLYGQIAAQSSGRIERGQRDVSAQAARTGMSRAGYTQNRMGDVVSDAENARGEQTVGVQLEKIKTDYQDKQAALDRAQKYLDAMRDNAYRYALLGEQRRQYDANLTLAYANLSQQRSMLQQQLQSAWDMMQAEWGYRFLLPAAG
jgi:hypothetical protein